VAARLTRLGAGLDAMDAEGRTALHLAAGCGDRAMVLQLVELGSDVNSRDSVGGEDALNVPTSLCAAQGLQTASALGCRLHTELILLQPGPGGRTLTNLKPCRAADAMLQGLRCTMRRWPTSGR
jgi:Ankyrin repeat